MERPGPVETGGSPGAETARRRFFGGDRQEMAYALLPECQKIDRRCGRLRRIGRGKRYLAVVDRRDPILMRHRDYPGSEIKLAQLDTVPGWSIRMMYEEGFPVWGTVVGSEDGRERYLRLTHALATHIEANLIRDDDGFRLDGHMVLIPKPDLEEWFCRDFGIPLENPNPYTRIELNNYPAAGVHLLQQGLEYARRVH